LSPLGHDIRDDMKTPALYHTIKLAKNYLEYLFEVP